MKKKAILRALIGAPIGPALSILISIMISVSLGTGDFYFVVPELTARCGSELNAVILQTCCVLLYGAFWGAASVIWEMERWSLLRQTVTHLLLGSFATLPIAYFMRWLHPSFPGVILYFAMFYVCYAVIWVCIYFSIKKSIRKINKKVHDLSRDDDFLPD